MPSTLSCEFDDHDRIRPAAPAAEESDATVGRVAAVNGAVDDVEDDKEDDNDEGEEEDEDEAEAESEGVEDESETRSEGPRRGDVATTASE